MKHPLHESSTDLSERKNNVIHLEHKSLDRVTEDVEGPGRGCVIDLNFVRSYQFHQRREQFVAHVTVESIIQPIERNCFSEIYIWQLDCSVSFIGRVRVLRVKYVRRTSCSPCTGCPKRSTGNLRYALIRGSSKWKRKLRIWIYIRKFLVEKRRGFEDFQTICSLYSLYGYTEIIFNEQLVGLPDHRI